MKRILPLLLAAVLLCTLLSLPAAAQQAAAFTISSGSSFTQSTRTENEQHLLALQGLMDNGTKVTAGPAQSTELAQIVTDGNTTYTVVRDDADQERVYLSDETGNTWRVDSDAFYELASVVTGFYKHRAIPTAQLSGVNAPQAAIVSSNYNFKKLDGIFYRTQYQAAGAPTVEAVGSGLMLPTLPKTAASVTVTVTKNGDSVFSGTWQEASAYQLSGTGAYLVQVDANYSHDDYKGKVTYQYHINRGGEVQFSVDGANTYPGEVVVLRAKGLSSGQSITVDTNVDFTPKFYDDGEGGKIAFLPVSYVLSKGEYYIQLSAGGSTQRFGITANGKEFQVQNLTMSESTTEETIASEKANNEFNEKFLPLRWDDDAVQHWEGRFVLPVQGARVTTEFGCIRYTNGSSESSRHGGVDLACATGTRISAPNNGRVVFAGYLQLTGYTILIEHGYGLKSWYYHMNAVDVKGGDMVVTGQKIGEVGSTGYSTGPHLHFATSINNVFINPYTLINTDLIV